MELLSPAGDFESLKMAVFYGADEVYLGVKDFNARNIEGFSLNSLREAVDFAHVFGVKVHLAVNILFSNSELQQALDLVVDAFNLGVDAFIIQDLGLASLISKNYPEICIHASTQMGLHNLEGVQFAKKLGFSRVVLSRETPLDEIKRIKQNCDIEIEYFAQGALCVSFSGNCYLSSYLYGASGNRGKCKQLCRLPYKLFDGNKKLAEGYLLSAKDFCMANRLQELKGAGVDAIKIEGRARRPYYVAVATREYRNALDGKPADINELKLAYNRDFTPGYFDGNGNIISNYKNHIGVQIGKITKVVRGKNFNEIFISSRQKIAPKSTIKTFDGFVEKNTLTLFDIKEVGKNLYCATTTQNVESGLQVNLIIDASKNDVENFTRKIEIDLKIQAVAKKNLRAEFVLNNKTYVVEGEKCEEAQNQPLNKDEIINNFSKNPYFCPHLFIETKNAFVPKQKLNEFRRKVYEKIFAIKTENNNKKLNKIKVDTNVLTKGFENFETTQNSSGIYHNKNVVYSPEIYDIYDIQNFVKNCLKQNKVPYLDTPNFALKKDIELLKNIIEKTHINIVVNNYYALAFLAQKVAGAGLNVFNNISAKVLGVPVICAESEDFPKMQAPFMTLRHCPMKSHLHANCSNCPYHEGYYYVLESGKTLRLTRKKLLTCTFYLE